MPPERGPCSRCSTPAAPSAPLSASFSNQSSSSSATGIGSMRSRSSRPWRPSRRARSAKPALNGSGGGAAYSASRKRASRAMRLQNAGQRAASLRAYAADRFDRARHVAPELEPAARGQRHRDPWIGPLQRQPFQSQRAQDLGRDPAFLARSVLALDHHHLAARAREELRRHQRVSAAADDDGPRHGAPRIARAALRPDAPITPPPGCVPAPHW